MGGTRRFVRSALLLQPSRCHERKKSKRLVPMFTVLSSREVAVPRNERVRGGRAGSVLDARARFKGPVHVVHEDTSWIPIDVMTINDQ